MRFFVRIKMRIGIFLWRDINHPDAGGSEKYFYELAKRWVKWGHEVVWFSSSFDGCLKEEVIDGISVIRKGGKFTVYIGAVISYLKKKQKKFDAIVDVENGIPFFTPFFVKSRIFLHIHHIHKDVWNKEMAWPLSSVGRFLEMNLMPIAYHGKRIITLSKSSAEEILLEKITPQLFVKWQCL